MEDKSKGIVYVATKQDRYVAEAFLSAASAKALAPHIPVTLFTNLVDSPFARAPCFDNVVPVDTIEAFQRSWSEGQLDRILCLPRSPYEYTLHLDSDTRVRSAEIASVFSLLDDHDLAMVECDEDNSYSREHYGRPMFNVGFILYRNDDKVGHLFDAWAELTSEYFALARGEDEPQLDCLAHVDDPDLRRKLLFMDQISLVQMLSPEVNRFGLDFRILDESWNYRGSRTGRPPPSDLKVEHHPDLRKRFFVRDLAVQAMRCHSEGQRELAIDILRWTDGEYPGNMDVMKFLILCQLDMEQHDEAVRTLDRMLERFPGYRWAEAARARIRTRRGRNGD